MEAKVGLRVVRGPDWQWGDQDGGEGGVGTVTDLEGKAIGGRAVVLWDNGYRSKYRCGAEGKYELTVYDSGPSGISHQNACNACHRLNIFGMRWKCAVCVNFDVCTRCYYSGEHSLEHAFSRIDSMEDQRSVTLPPRMSSKKITARGLFPEAKVVRGDDWCWADQDGGKCGVIKSVQGYRSETERSVVEVVWTGSQKRNIYRAGHKGKVDLKCLTPGEGGYFYPEHLPKLGAADKDQPKTPTVVPAIEPTSVGASKPPPISSVAPSSSTPTVAVNSVPPPASVPSVTAKPLVVAPPVSSPPLKSVAASTSSQTLAAKTPSNSTAQTSSSSSSSAAAFPSGAGPIAASATPTATEALQALSPDVVAKSTLSTSTEAGILAPPSANKPASSHSEEAMPVVNNSASAGKSAFVSGDRVRVMLELEIFKMMQEGHGGWNEQMNETLTAAGIVQTVLDSGDIRVRYPSNCVWTMNPDTVVKVEEFVTGDVVRILDDMSKVHSLQEDHGGWNDDMALCLGQVGRIATVFPSGDIRVGVNGMLWTFNPACLVPAPGENPPELPTELSGVSGMAEMAGMSGMPGMAGAEGLSGNLEELQLKLLSLLGNSAVVVAAAASGDESTVRDYLSKNPQEVNAKAGGRTALHCALGAGNVDMVKTILEFNPDLEIGDEDGDTPLHVCAWTDEDEAAKLFIDHGARINSINKKGATPLIIAAIKGHHSVLKLLVTNPQVKLHEQESDGNTALHCAVMAQKNECVSTLLEAGADPTLLNFRLYTPIHEAARVGFLPAIEQFVRKQQDYINLRKDDGFTTLHLASLNDHLDVVTALADMEFCNINEVTDMGQTALHLAIHQGHDRVVERLVGYGAELDLQDGDGDTALHLAFMREGSDGLSAETPQLNKLRESLNIPDGMVKSENAVIACFLIQEGATLMIQNNRGITPIEMSSPEIATMVMTFDGSLSTRTPKKFHGSMRAPPAPSVETATTANPSTNKVQSPVSTDRPNSQPVASADLATGSNVEECFLCESPVEVRFEPCGHAILCSACAERAKKCIKCRAPVKSISLLKVICPMCNEDEATVTMQPCGHQFCPGCAKRMKRCFDCRKDITVKEGLTVEEKTSVSGGGDSPYCAICLTEPKDTVLICGHRLCWDCAQKVDNCPVCRKFVTHRIRLFQ